MAATLKTLRWADLAVGISIFVLAALAGCQTPQASNKAMVANLPPPSFDGPNVIARPPAAAAARAPVTQLPSGPAGWKPRAAPRDWKWIVIHHSASPTGSMALFDKEHKAKGWDGIGYHFVIGNGTASGDGQVEVTARWTQQKWGAHAKTADNRYNEQGIGICLVGNFDIERPSANQMRSLSRLVSTLMQQYGIPPQNIVGHRDTKPTDCPGRHVNIASIRSSASAGMAGTNGRADSGIGGAPRGRAAAMFGKSAAPAPAGQTASGIELLTEVGR